MEAPIVRILNEITPRLIGWCTPSILPGAPVVDAIYRSDMSVSYMLQGDPTKPSWDEKSGVFGRAQQLAGRAFHANVPGDPGYCLFSVNGASGANHMIIKALRIQFGAALHILADRNLHKSLAVACEDYRVKLTLLPPAYHCEYQIFLPSRIDAFVQKLREDPTINVFLITNPTYEGLAIDLQRLIRELRAVREDVVVFVDESWGGNFQFSPRQPATAMDSGADVAVVSTHKQGGALQQTAVMLWRTRRIDSDAMYYAYRTLVTTSPSWHLLASIDAARAYLEEHGAEAIEREIEIAEYLEAELQDLLPRVTADEICADGFPDIVQMDRTKLVLHTHHIGLSGDRLADELASIHGVVVERADAETLVLIVPFQNTMAHAVQSVAAIRSAINVLREDPKAMNRPRLAVPKTIERVKFSFEVGPAVAVPLDDRAIGRVCAEHIAPYPPGIPLIMKGERVLREHIDYLAGLRASGKTIDMYCMFCANNILVESSECA